MDGMLVLMQEKAAPISLGVYTGCPSTDSLWGASSSRMTIQEEAIHFLSYTSCLWGGGPDSSTKRLKSKSEWAMGVSHAQAALGREKLC